MHIEILIEDQSGKVALDLLIPMLIENTETTFRVIPYKGIGRLPKGLKSVSEANKRQLLSQLPSLLKGYGKSFQDFPATVIFVFDLDNNCLKDLKHELNTILQQCHPKPHAHFCIAIEEGEAWLLGDFNAIRTAYPKVKENILKKYNNDAICGTWEILANAIYQGGVDTLKKKGWQTIGMEKSNWAENITPHFNIKYNKSPSFQYLCQKIRESIQ